MHLSTFVPLLLSVTNAQLYHSTVVADLEHMGAVSDSGELTDVALVSALSNSTDFGQITTESTQTRDSIELASDSFAIEKEDVVTTSERKGSPLLSYYNPTNATLTAAWKNPIATATTDFKEQWYGSDGLHQALEADGRVDCRSTAAACVAIEGCARYTGLDFDDKYAWVPLISPGSGRTCPSDDNPGHKPAYYSIVAPLASIGKTISSTNSGVEGGGPFAATKSTSSSSTSNTSVKITSTVPAPKPSSTLVEAGVSGMLHYTSSIVWASWFLGTFFTIILAEIV